MSDRAEQRNRRPNLILFMTDRHQADRRGCYGNPTVSPPVIDGLAAAGWKADEMASAGFARAERTEALARTMIELSESSPYPRGGPERTGLE